MKKLIQTRLHKGMDKPEDRGNCFPTVISCFMDLESPEDCIQIQEYYKSNDVEDNHWVMLLDKWIREKGWELGSLDGHQYDDSYYLVTGPSPRGINHICIYQNGQLYHDPHPDNIGLVQDMYFEYLDKLE